MKRPVIWVGVALLVLLTLGTIWFLDRFEQVPGSRWEGPHKEALRNPFLALERLAGELGRPATRIASPQRLDNLPEGAILLLDRNRRQNVSPARADKLLDWVARGGHLVVAAEAVGDDPLLTRLGVRHFEPPASMQCKPDNAPAPPPAPKAKSGLMQAPPAPPPPVEVHLPGRNVSYRLQGAGDGHFLSVSEPLPEWRAGPSDERNVLLHYGWGQGRVTVLSSFSSFNNRHLGELDHAELIWALVQQHRPQGALFVASRMEVPTLWQWLAESAWMVLVSAAALLLVWLWRIVPRFGQVLEVPPAERRDLSQHLMAIGRCVWREGGIAHWLTVVRQTLTQRLALRHPYLSRQDASQQRIALAKIADCRTRDIQSALSPDQATQPAGFTAAMQVLQRLDQRI